MLEEEFCFMAGLVKWAFTLLRKHVHHNLQEYIMLILICYDILWFLCCHLNFHLVLLSGHVRNPKMDVHVWQFFFFGKSASLFLMLLRHIQKDFRHMVSCFSSSPLGIKHSKSLLYCQSINTIPANSLGQAAFTSIKTQG